MSTAYHSLASGTFTQSWSNSGQITTDDNWSGVPSITGYLGDINSAIDADPRTLTAAALGAVDVIANQTNPDTLTTGGVAEFAITNPTVALQGSGTADAPSLVFYLDATGRQDVRVQFNARDIDASADNAAQQLNVQYRVGSSGEWTNVTNGYLADVTTGGSATQSSAVDVTLPAAANNQAQVEVRVLTTNAAGSDEWVGIDDVNISSAALGGTAIDLSTYVLVARHDLPEPTRTVAPPNSLLAQEVSAVTYDWDTDTLFVVGDGGTSVVQVSKTGQLINSMTLAPGGSPQGTAFYDPEGLTYIGNGQFVMTEERDRQAVKFTYAPGTTLQRSDTQTVKLGTFVQNIGLEGLSYDPQTGGFIFVKETQPEGIFQTNIDFAAGTATNGSPTTENSVNLFDPALAGLADFADVFALSNLPSLNGTPEASHLLVLSQEDGRILNVDRAGQIYSALTIVSNPGNPLSVPAQQHEGLTMDRDGNLYVVSENGGGDFDHPQLWVYAPSSVANQAPTGLALNNQTNSLAENTNTTARIKVADVAITDDGLGTNQLTVTGADAAFFEVDSNGLYIKAGTTLDFETKSSYSVTVNVDDVTVGSTPDATAPFTLNLTDVVNEGLAAPALYISEVAPWSSGNSPTSLQADWFEVTNSGTSALDITDWKMDDSSAAFASAVALNGITTINPGESVIFLETGSPGDLAAKKAAFLSTWFGANAPANLQVGSYSGGGVGLSTGGDAVNLFNGQGVLQASITFGTSAAGPFPTFDNSIGLNNTTFSQLSATGVHSAFAAAGDAAEIGSPGTVGKLFISEVAPWSSGNSPASLQADWFEVTNSSAFAVDITGWKMDDNSQSPAAAVALNGITTIRPGESVIFLETANAGELPAKAAAFLSTWFGSNAPAGLQIGSYSGSGVGLSTGGDAVNLYNSTGVLQASVAFGASPSGPSFSTFDNAAGSTGAPTPVSQLSAAGVNGGRAAVGDVNELGSPGQIGIRAIHDIQGSGRSSLLVGQTVTTLGVVVAADTNGSRGYYIQDASPDGDSHTSEGIFIFTNSATLPVPVGHLVEITGVVSEFLGSGAAPGSLSTTQITATAAGSVVDLGESAIAITPTVIGGPGGLLPPTEDLTAGTNFFESLEGMLVTVKAPVTTGPTNSFGEIEVVVDNDSNPANGTAATGQIPRGNLLLTPGQTSFGNTDTQGGDFNPERIQIDDDSGILPGFVSPAVSVGAHLGDVTGIVNYDFGNYQVVPTTSYAVTQASTLVKETGTLAGDADHLLIASYNAENLDPKLEDINLVQNKSASNVDDDVAAGRFDTFAGQIFTALHAPDIVALQEIQDNDGAEISSVTSASATLQLLADKINALAVGAGSSAHYSFIDNPFINNNATGTASGGQPGGNIRTAYLYRDDRVDFVEGSLKTIGADGSAITDPAGNADQATNPDNPFFTARPPLAATFTFNGQDVTVIDNHFTSKSGSGVLFGSTQPPFDGGEVQRAAQAQAVNTFIDGILAADPAAKVVVAGDLNEFQFEQPISVIKGQATLTNYDTPGTDPFQATATYTPGGSAILSDLQDKLPANERYDYVFEGNSETLDHMLVTNNLDAGTQFDVVHLNSEFADQTSDHDPLVASVSLPPSQFKLQILHLYGEAGTLAASTAPILGAMVDKFKALDPNTLVVAEGDTWIPGPWLVAGADPSLNAVPGIGSTALARPDVAIMNALGVNVSALGNHEFDLGSPVVSGAITASGTWAGAQFPFITGNLDFSADASLKPLADASIGGNAANQFAGQEASAIKGKIAPYTVVTINGEKVGVVGATTYDLLIKTSPNDTVPKDDGNPSTSDLQEVAAYIQASVDALTAAGVNKIVMVDQLDTIERNKLLAPMVSGIDIMVAGGGHERQGDATDTPVAFNGHDANFIETYPVVTAGQDGATTLIVTTDTEFSYLGRLEVAFDGAGHVDLSSLNPATNGAYGSNEATLQAVYGSNQTAQEIIAGSVTGSKVQAIASAINDVVVAKDGTKFGFSDVYLEGDRVFGRTEETNLGDVSADANTFVARQALGADVPIISIKNGGGIRASIGSIDEDGQKVANGGTAAGNISQLDVENALRFDNKLMVFDTDPQGLFNIAEFMGDLAAQGAAGSQQGGFPQIGGLRFSFDPDLPAGQRVQNVALIDEHDVLIAKIAENGVLLAGAPSTIDVVILNFTANGGDGYPIKANGSNFRFLLNDGTLSQPVDEALDFTAAANVPANALGEQAAFEDFLQTLHNTPGTAIDLADTPASGDLRIENLNVRADAVFENVITGTPGNDTLRGGAGDDTVIGGSGDDAILGLDGNDTLNGNGGNDQLLGGAGADIMTGGTGNDRYYVDNAGDQVIEATGQGTDHVYSTVDYTLTAGQEIESLRVYGVATGLTLAGNELDNYLVGGAGSDTLTGRGGDDQLQGGTGADNMAGGIGNDKYYVDNAGDQVTEATGQGTDHVYSTVDYTLAAGQEIESLRVYGVATGLTLTGNEFGNYLLGGAGNDTLTGGGGDDQLQGGTGADNMAGVIGNDQYYVDNAGDQVNEATGQGTDHVYSTVDYTLAAGQEIESLRVYGVATGLALTGNEFGNYLLGGAGSDTLTGGGGDDQLQGGTGADNMAGGIGNDKYYVDNAGDQVNEATGQGTDHVYSTVDYTLAAGQEIESLRVYGVATGLTLTGNEFGNYLLGGAGSDTLTGGGGDDQLQGGTGADNMAGGIGNDQYYVDNAGDQVNEATGQGTDHVYSTVDYTLAAGQEIESLRVYEVATGLTLTGNELDNYLVGGAGSDTLTGGAGNDTLFGGLQGDRFAVTNDWGNDTVADFENGLDLIDLHDLSAPHGFDQLAITQLGADVMITVAGVAGSSITLKNTLVPQIDRNDFVF